MVHRKGGGPGLRGPLPRADSHVDTAGNSVQNTAPGGIRTSCSSALSVGRCLDFLICDMGIIQYLLHRIRFIQSTENRASCRNNYRCY